MLGKTGRFVKIIFLFLRGHTDSKCEVIITGKRANLGDNKSMQVPCEFQFVGKDKQTHILIKERTCRVKNDFEQNKNTELHEFSSEFCIKT